MRVKRDPSLKKRFVSKEINYNRNLKEESMNAISTSQEAAAMSMESQNIVEQASNDSINDVKLERFKMQDVFDLYDDLDCSKWALKAISELLCSSDLEMFSEHEGYRTGLRQLFDMCLDRQEERVERFFQKAANSPELIIERAKDTINALSNSDYSPLTEKHRVSEVISKLDSISSLFDKEQYPEINILRLLIISKAP